MYTPTIWREWVIWEYSNFLNIFKKNSSSFIFFKYQKWHAALDTDCIVKAYHCLAESFLHSPFAYIEPPEKIPPVTLNVFSKTLPVV